MAFTEEEKAAHLKTIEDLFWSKRRPPTHLRDKVRERQSIEGQSVELFLHRPAFRSLGEWIEEPIAKITYVRKSNRWRVFWQRADLKWHRYPPKPEAKTLSECLRIIDEDANACFFG